MMRYSITHYTWHTVPSDVSRHWSIEPRDRITWHVTVTKQIQTARNTIFCFFVVWSVTDVFVSLSSINHLCLVFSTHFNLALRDESSMISMNCDNLFTYEMCLLHFLVSNQKSSIKITLMMECLEQLSSSRPNVLAHFLTVRECLRLL